MTETQRISAIIKAGAAMTNAELCAAEVKRWKASEERAAMLTGQRYYNAQNDMLTNQRLVIGENGQLVPAKNISDNRLAHAFVRELTDQKTQYLLGKAYSIGSEDKQYLAALNDLLTDDFARLLRRTAKDAITKGIAYLHVYYNEQGVFSFKRMNPEEMIPLWADAEHTQLDAMIRVYDVETYEGRELKIVEKVEIWTTEGVERYTLDGDQMTLDEQEAHVRVKAGQNEQPLNWERVPFIAIKYNDEELPLVLLIKSLVDEYDRVASNDSNILADQPNSVLVVRNYDGLDLGEFRRNLAAYRAVKVTDDGGLDALATPVTVEASSVHLERIRRDIYAFGRGVDTRDDKMVAASGVALRHKYAQLDMDCNALENEIQASFEQLLWFINRHFANSRIGDFEGANASIVLNRDIIISEMDAVNMCKASKGIISDDTIVGNHPWVKNVAQELKQLKEQQEEAIEKFSLPYQPQNGEANGQQP